MNQGNKVSVLMCVYNGERFLIEQLESLRNQTYQPDEVIIHDDCSDDSSIITIKEFITKYNLESTWRINVNPSRKGWRLNFYDAIAECDGDYIFFCDQDDIWFADKISMMIDVINKNKNILVLNGLMETIDSSGNPINISDWTREHIHDRKIIESCLGDTIYVWKQRIGCTMVIQKTIRDQLKYFGRNEYFAHDAWSLNIGALLGGCYHINYPVIKYRVHGNNATANITDKIPNRTEKIQELEEKINDLEYIFNGIKLMDKTIIDKKEYASFLKAIGFYKFKLSLLKKFKLMNFFGIFLYAEIYFKYFSFKELIVDILDCLNLRSYARNIKYNLRKVLSKIKKFILRIFSCINKIIRYLYEMIISLFDKRLRICFTNFQDVPHDFFLLPLCEVLRQNSRPYKIVKYFNPHIQFFSVFGKRKSIVKSKALCKIFFTGENTNNIIDNENYKGNCIENVSLSFGFDYIKADNYFRFPLWLLYYFQSNDSKDVIRNKLNAFKKSYQKYKFCALVASHDRSGIRTKIYNEVSKIGSVDCPGNLLHNDDTLHKRYNNNKAVYLQQYKFNICPENSISPGYVTEKLFQSLYSGCIPIYNGWSKNVEPDIVNPDIILWYDAIDEKNNLSFNNEIRKINSNDKLYRSFTDQPFFCDTAVDKIYIMLQQFMEKIQRIIYAA